MKKILNVLLGIIGVVYFIVVIGVTVCLLCYNGYKVTEINGKSLIIIDNNDKYSSGDLVVFEKSDVYNIGDEIFFYEVTNGVVSINVGSVTDSSKITDDEYTITINDNHDISSTSIIGKTADAKVYSKIGKILGTLESKFGFLILVILPTLVLFLYEVYRLIIEIKTPIEE